MKKTFIRTYGRIAWLIILGMLLLLIDFVSKAYVFHLLPFNKFCPDNSCWAIPVFHNFGGIDFYISLTVNKGAAWGFFADFQIILLVIRILVILGMFVYLFFLNHTPAISIPLVFIIAGAIGNVVDFFLYGFVIDFLLFNLWGYHFPVFNFADTCITIGVIALLLVGLFNSKKKNKYA